MMVFDRIKKENPTTKKTEIEYVDRDGKHNFGLVITEDGIRFRGESQFIKVKNDFMPVMKILDGAMRDYWELADKAGRQVETVEQQDAFLDAGTKRKLEGMKPQ